MHESRRIRLELDPETYELNRYFAELRGITLNQHLRKVLARFSETAKTEHPPLRAHMLAWLQAKTSESVATYDSDELPY